MISRRGYRGGRGASDGPADLVGAALRRSDGELFAVAAMASCASEGERAERVREGERDAGLQRRVKGEVADQVGEDLADGGHVASSAWPQAGGWRERATRR